MNGLTSRDMVRIGDGMIPPRAGLPGILAAPVPHDDALRLALATVPAGGIPRLLDAIAYHRIDGLAHRAVERLPQDSIDPSTTSKQIQVGLPDHAGRYPVQETEHLEGRIGVYNLMRDLVIYIVNKHLLL